MDLRTAVEGTQEKIVGILLNCFRNCLIVLEIVLYILEIS